MQKCACVIRNKIAPNHAQFDPYDIKAILVQSSNISLLLCQPPLTAQITTFSKSQALITATVIQIENTAPHCAPEEPCSCKTACAQYKKKII